MCRLSASSLCSFPTRQSAHDWIVQHRLALARHYLCDDKLSQQEVEDGAKQDGVADEYFLDHNVSMEILAIPHFADVASAPNPNVSNLLFEDHYASHVDEETAEAAEGNGEAEEKGEGAGVSGKKPATKRAASNKRHKAAAAQE